MSNSLVSIIVPVYKVEQYLPRCIDSLITQSYSNIEIILVDDVSELAIPMHEVTAKKLKQSFLYI